MKLSKIKKLFTQFRYWLAYAIAPDLIIDLEERLTTLLCHVTGGLLSKTNYTADTMISAADDYQQRMCDDCCREKSEQDGGEA